MIPTYVRFRYRFVLYLGMYPSDGVLNEKCDIVRFWASIVGLDRGAKSRLVLVSVGSFASSDSTVSPSYPTCHLTLSDM